VQAMIITVDGEALVAYRAVAAQAAAEANQIRLDADLAVQGEAMWIIQEVANNGQCAMFMEPAPAERQKSLYSTCESLGRMPYQFVGILLHDVGSTTLVRCIEVTIAWKARRGWCDWSQGR